MNIYNKVQVFSDIVIILLVGIVAIMLIGYDKYVPAYLAIPGFTIAWWFSYKHISTNNDYYSVLSNIMYMLVVGLCWYFDLWRVVKW